MERSTHTAQRSPDSEQSSAIDWTKDERIQPLVSVILPIRNEAQHIQACIAGLVDQDYPTERTELIVVDGRSEDGTREILASLQERYPDVRLIVLDNPARAIAPALNIALRAAQGEVIVRMDGHAIPAQNYVTACVEALRHSGAASVGGVLGAVGTTPFGAAVALATTHRLGAGDAKYRIGSAPGFVDTVPFGAYRREVFGRVGLFDESMMRNEDNELFIRIRSVGERVFLDPTIRFTYTPRGTARGLWSQYFQYGWWRVETSRRHPRSTRMRQVIPPLFVTGLIGGALLAPWCHLAAIGLGLLLLVYGATVFGASALLSSQGVPTLRIALAFAIVHVAWGLGFLTNLVTGGAFPYRARPPNVPTKRDEGWRKHESTGASRP